MSSLTTIGNQALKNVGAKGIMTDYSTDPSAEGEAVRRDIKRVINEILEENDWGFARRQQTLELHADDAPIGWAYRYTLFSDCLVPLDIIVAGRPRNADPLDFDVLTDEAGLTETLVTDTADACLLYTTNIFVESPNRWSHIFERCVEHKLSYLLAINLRKKEAVARTQYGLYRATLLKSIYVNNKGRRRFQQQNPRSIRARR